MARFITFRFDVTALTERQRKILAGSVIAQHEESDFDYETTQEWADENYPTVKVAEVCHFCGQVIEDGECGGEGESICTELMCVTDFALPGKLSPTYSDDVEAYVRDYCAEHGIEDSLVPYRADGLTYYQQLAYMVREHHDLPQPKGDRPRDTIPAPKEPKEPQPMLPATVDASDPEPEQCVPDDDLAADLPEYNGWSATYEYPGYIHYSHPASDVVVSASSDFSDDGKLDIQIQTRDGHSFDDGSNDPWPHAGRTPEKLFARLQSYLDKYQPTPSPSKEP